ncbi:MAG: (2Fe-2S)-binding protein [Thermomonas sp.]|uniref:(2Fe-2S)-binding protein n=1 Tax=Thermomonas sp. TaxID=1971895 RepID=UPI00261E3E7C|nr:(2Fe-2S)-binding protein [Thermomonas sp.]MCC7096787.1 (2Fe-2S)-binding protein [Thermomonas sp.]
MYVCICNGVTDRTIRESADAGCESVAEMTMRTGAGACCGSCVGLVAEIIAEVQTRRHLELPLLANAA